MSFILNVVKAWSISYKNFLWSATGKDLNEKESHRILDLLLLQHLPFENEQNKEVKEYMFSKNVLDIMP